MVSPLVRAARDCNLTEREAEILASIEMGKPNKVIAYELGISESTVKVHARNLMTKLHAANRTHLAFLARSLSGMQKAAAA
jgi:DNA-binding NarL/FixJ family response regulator